MGSQQVGSQGWKLALLLTSYFIVSVVHILGIQLYGPFLRTLVTCEVPVEPGAPFSGSAHCGDRKLVLAVAQRQEGTLVSIKLIIHGFVAPVIGGLADQVGRKPMLLVSFGGFSLAYILFATVAAATSLHTFKVILFCFVVDGATNAFDVCYRAMIADLVPVASERPRWFVAYQMTMDASTVVAQVSAAHMLRMEFESYVPVWIVLAAVLVADMLFVQAALPETLMAKAAPSGRSVSNLILEVIQKPAKLVLSDKFLRTWLFQENLDLLLGSGMMILLPAWTISVYGWQPGDYQAYTWPGTPLTMACTIALVPLVAQWHPAVVTFVTVPLNFLGNIANLFACLSPVFLLGPLYIGCLISAAGSAGAAFFTLQFPSEQQATVNALNHLLKSVSHSTSIMLFSSPLVFRAGVKGWAASTPFVIAFVGRAIACSIKMHLVWPHVKMARMVKVTDFHDV